MLAPTLVRRRDHVLGLALAIGYLSVLLSTAPDLGMARDEAFYVEAATSYANWFTRLVEEPEQAIERNVVDRYWIRNAEHPPLMKSLFALSYMAQQEEQWFAHESTAFRFPGMVSASLLLWLIYIFGARTYGRLAGFMAALFYALLPRPFYHSHLDCFDVPIVLMITLVIYCYYRSLTRPWWSLWVGITFGLALATKHNSWILPGVLFVHFCWLRFANRLPHSRPETPTLRRSRLLTRRWLRVLPLWAGSLFVMGPPMLIALWPWIWPERLSFDPLDWQRTIDRFSAYAQFHLNHEYYNMAYLGRNYFEPPFPRSYPWVMMLMTVPTTTLVLAATGLIARFRSLLPRRTQGEGYADRSASDVLFVGCFFAPLAVFLLPNTPIFGGTKHWFAAYPFLCLFAGAGFVWLIGKLKARFRLAFLPVAAAVALAPAAIETAHSHPFGLSHYTMPAGFVPGSADLGMNRQFWGFTTGSLVDFFRRELPDGGSVWICDTAPTAWEMLHRDHHLPPSIVDARSIAAADFALVHHEHHFAEVEFQIWEVYQTVKPAYVLTYDGVPIISVYENPEREPNR